MSDETTAAVPAASEAATPEVTPEVTGTKAPEVKTDEQTTAVDAKVTTDAEVKYEWKTPEGFEVDITKLEDLARQFKVPANEAQGFLDSLVAFRASEEQAREAGWKQTQEGWISELKADPKLGGANFEKTQSRVNAVAAKFGDAAFKEFMDASGVGNHPALVRMLAGIGAAMEQDSFVSSNSSVPKDEDIAKRMRFFEPNA